MADFRLLRFLLIFCLYWIQAESVRTKTKIYIDLQTQSACFRHLNATHQLGCASSQGGNVGVLFYVQKPEEDLDWILSKGPHPPYIAVLDSADFYGDNVRRLYKRTDRVAGIMVISLPEMNTNNSAWTSELPQDGFSVSDSCPNDMTGLYRDSEDYGGCKKTKWNPPGIGLMRQDLGIPVFALTDESDVNKVLHKCFFKFNARENTTARGYPLCAAELKTEMFGAVDSETCLRRSSRGFSFLTGSAGVCDPMGDKNNHVTMMNTPDNETRSNDSVIVVGARMDSAALFMHEYQSADTSVTGIVGLLAAMEALWKVKDKIRNTKNAKDIMFAFFQGESYDYIGSSNMVYSMQRGIFPQDLNYHRSALHLHNIGLNHINQFVELNQVGHRDNENSLWMHTDPDSRKAKKLQIQGMIDGLQTAAIGLDVKIQEADASQPLPPASSQRFLMERRDIPVVVITDHQAEFTNKYYNSRLDLAKLINATDYPPGLSAAQKYDHVTTQAEMLTSLSTALARYLYKASTGADPDDAMKETLTANSSTVTHLLYCFLVSPNCELFNELADNANNQEEGILPYSFYVGVHGEPAAVTSFVFRLMARFTGDRLDLDKSRCKGDGKDQRYNYLYVQGNLVDGSKHRRGWCIKSMVQMTDALSPAFQIDGYDMKSGKYSTWTESRWGYQSIKVRLFLVPSQQLQASVLASGIVVLVLSLLLVYWCNVHGSHIFTQQRAGTGDQTTYSPMF